MPTLTGGTLAAQTNRIAGKPTDPPRGQRVIVLDGYAHATNYLPVAVKAFRVNVAGTVAFVVRNGGDSDPTAVMEISRAFAAGAVWDMAPVLAIRSLGTATGLDGVY